MADKDGEYSVVILKNELACYTKEQEYYRDLLLSLNDKIKVTRKKLFDTCDHKWVRMHDCGYDDLCNKRCRICGLTNY